MKKKCNRCQRKRELTDFYPSKGGSHGRYSVCKICVSSKRKEKNLEESRMILGVLIKLKQEGNL